MRNQTFLRAALSIVAFISVCVLGPTEGKAQSSATLSPTIAPPPDDPFELVTSQPKPVEAREARSSLEGLLHHSLQKSAFQTGRVPYTVTISFTASGDAQDVGPGEMEETRNESGDHRWTGHLGNYSLTRITTDGPHDVGSPGPIPMRLYMTSEHILGIPYLLKGVMRMANATLNGTPVICILSSGSQRTVAPRRDWSENEYCVDSQSELLRVYSTAPGIYVVYDYGRSSFHGHEVPDRITMAVAGRVVLQGNISVKDPDSGSLDPVLFTPTSQMTTNGVQFTGPRFHHIQPKETNNASSLLQPIVVHAMLSPDGSVVEAEALQTSNPELSRSAVDCVKKTKFEDTAGWIVPPQMELFVTVQ